MWRPAQLPRLYGTALLAAAMLVTAGLSANAVAADETCSDVTLTPGTRLTSTKTSSGPHTILLAAGRYIVTGTSTDLLHGPATSAQTAESWSFMTDTGYSSGTTPDLPDLLTSTSYGFGEIEFSEAIGSITFIHQGDGSSPNSVEPSLSFVCLQPPPPTTASTTSTTSTTSPPTSSIAPTTTERVSTPTTTPGGEVAPTSVVAPTTIAEPATTLPPTTSTPGAVKPIEIERPGPTTLPRTGGNTAWAWLGVALLAAGAGLMAVSKRPGPTDA